MRVELQLKVAWCANQRRTLVPEPLQRLDTTHVDRDQIRQVDLERHGVRAGFQQLWHLRAAQAPSQSHKAPIALVRYADPTVHGSLRGKTQAIGGSRRRKKTGVFNGIFAEISALGPRFGRVYCLPSFTLNF